MKKVTLKTLYLIVCYSACHLLLSCQDEEEIESCQDLNERVTITRSNYLENATKDNCDLYKDALNDYINNNPCNIDENESENLQKVIDNLTCL